MKKFQTILLTFFIATTASVAGENLSATSFDQSKLLIYPNPASTRLNFNLSDNTAIDKIIISDMTGKTILEQNNATQINVQNLAKGIYVLELYSGKEKFQSKFMKE